MVECWDKLRETSISVLMSLETPLPGISDPAAVEGLVLWARKLAGSPRVRESDAGQSTSRPHQANWTTSLPGSSDLLCRGVVFSCRHASSWAAHRCRRIMHVGQRERYR